MWGLFYSVLAIFSVFMVSGNPGLRYVTETARVTAESSFTAQCRVAAERETCWNIFEEAINVGGEYSGLPNWFQHYCRTISPFVPCLQANKEDYRVLLHCSDVSTTQLILEQVWTFDELWDMAMDLMDATNNLICSRTDEVVEMVDCIMKKNRAFENTTKSCVVKHVYPLSSYVMENGGADLSSLCRVMYGYNGCLRDGISSICQGSSDLLETFYNDIVVGLVGTSAGCEAEPNPLLSFIRSVRDEWRR